jgi:hypothetical protein
MGIANGAGIEAGANLINSKRWRLKAGLTAIQSLLQHYRTRPAWHSEGYAYAAGHPSRILRQHLAPQLPKPDISGLVEVGKLGQRLSHPCYGQRIGSSVRQQGLEIWFEQ